jgi:L-alanine-DL-glutamate epimerase-like enolase superfamily enzyme
VNDLVAAVEVYLVDLSQGTPYLGTLREGENVDPQGYFVRKQNGTVYPRSNRSLAVRIVTEQGVEGWGETYGIVAPVATAEIIKDLMAGFVIGTDPFDVKATHDRLYDLMRVRGYCGGYYLDAMAGIDIALWDIAGKQSSLPVHKLLGGRYHEKIPCYVSGLPKDTLAERCEFASEWKEKGFDSVKFHSPVADDGVVAEMRELRKALGDDSRIAVDLHWTQTPASAIQLAREIAPYNPWFMEAPVPSENVEGLRHVANHSGQTIAVGEEWRTVFDARQRIDANAVHIVQPEMGHTGITEFMRIGQYAEAHHLPIIPHATIGSGIFLAASLQASAALRNVVQHEFQHSLLGPFRHFTSDVLSYANGAYAILSAPGIGVEPSDAMKQKMTRI